MSDGDRVGDVGLAAAAGLAAVSELGHLVRALDEAVSQFPDRPEYKIALARVLSTSADDHVRDAQRALDITQELFKAQRTTALGETIAMALAEYGDYTQAIAIQRDVVAAATRSTGNRPDYPSSFEKAHIDRNTPFLLASIRPTLFFRSGKNRNCPSCHYDGR